MSTSIRDVLVVVVLAWWFPVALALTDATSSEPGDLGTPTRERAPALHATR